ncbi:MAG: DUF2321 domain-containing protein [Chloroflexi bacterium]|nr:DUF2321 domain-containing protein [Chloroflexota bacterium]
MKERNEMPINPFQTGYDEGEACENGHRINGDVIGSPEDSSSFCPECGAATIRGCHQCGATLRGYMRGVVTGDWTLEAYCRDCGKPYHWTEASIQAAKDLLELEASLSSEDRELLATNLDAVTRDTPQTAVAAKRIKLVLAKVPGQAATAVRDIILGVATEAAKSAILGR